MKKGIAFLVLITILLNLGVVPNEVSATEEKESVVAMIGENEYLTLREAFDAVQSNKVETEVKVIRDFMMLTNEIATLGDNKNVVLNMNGKSITVDSSFVGRPIVNNGTLRITGDGVIDSSMGSDGYGAVNNYKNLMIDNGTYSGNINASGSCIKNNTNASLVINNGVFNKATCAIYNDVAATAIINNGIFDTRTCSSCSSVWASTVRNFGTLTFNNGTINGVQGGLAIAGGKTQINNGHFETFGCPIHGDNSAYYALYVAGERGEAEAIVNGGKFISASKQAVLVGNDNDGGEKKPAKCVIKNGEFITNGKENVPVIIRSPKTGDLSISGGTFCKTINNDFLISGYKQYGNENGTYTIAPMTTKVESSATSLSIEVGKKMQLNVTLIPSATLDRITYTSSDKEIATVDENGMISAKSNGTAVITIAAGSKTTTCDISVYQIETLTPPNIDTTQPPTDIEMGVQDDSSQDIIYNVVGDVIGDIKNGKAVSNDVIDTATLNAVKGAINSGKIVSVKVKVSKTDESKTTADEKKRVSEFINKLTSENNTEVVAEEYFDIEIMLIADNVELGTINLLDKSISFTVAIPSSLQKEGRKFYVIRVHDGKAEKLSTILNADGTLSFMTNKFSTYVLAYEDNKKDEVIPDITDETTNSTTKSEIHEIVKTNDNVNVDKYMGVIIVSVLIGIYAVSKRKQNNHS